MFGRVNLAIAAVLALSLGTVGEDQPAAQKEAPEKSAPQKQAPEKQAPGKQAREKTAGEKPAREKPILVRDLESNVRVRLVGARHSERRGRNLVAKFETLEKEPTVRVIDFPAHTFTTHEQTLRAVITGCVDMHDSDPDENGWHPAKADAFFSIPKEDAPREAGRYSQLDKCFLVSLKLKKE